MPTSIPEAGRSLEARFSCTLEDYLEAQKADKGAFSRYLLVIVGSLALILAALILQTRHSPTAYGFGVAGLYLIFAPTIFQPLYYKRDFRRHPGFTEETLVEINAEGIWTEAGTGRGEVRWSAFTKYQETPNLFMLYMGARLFRIVPKRAFAPHHVDEFRSLIARHLSPK